MAQAEICVTWARSGLGPFQLLGQNSSIGPLANSKCRRLVNWVGPFAQMGSRSNLMPERGSIRTKFMDGCASCRSLILCSQHKLTAHPFLRELVTRRFWPCQCLRWAQLCTFQRHPYVPFMLSWFSLSRHVCGRESVRFEWESARMCPLPNTPINLCSMTLGFYVLESEAFDGICNSHPAQLEKS